jgi:hypothetical protein
MRILSLLSIFALFFIDKTAAENATCSDVSLTPNNCISFTVSSGTGCAWMCNYCSTQLGTNNYYFVDGVCTYESGGCVGNPQAGKQYSCCSV